VYIFAVSVVAVFVGSGFHEGGLLVKKLEEILV
jgi:hypothetical protein